jgi:hypothetical protein
LISGAMQFGSYSAINETIQKCVDGAAPVLLVLYPKVSGFLWKNFKVKITVQKLMVQKFSDQKIQLKFRSEK